MRIQSEKEKIIRKRQTKLLKGLLFSSVILLPLTVSTLPSHSTLLGVLQAQAATDSNSAVLQPGQTLDTGNHTYKTSDIEPSAAWTTAGAASAVTDSTTDTFSTTLIPNTKDTAGLGLFKGALDMTQALSFQGTFSVTVNSDLLYKANAMDAGDSLGFILTPASGNEIQANLPNSVNQNLGIGGLSNSIFAGRDFFNNGSTDSENISDTAKDSQGGTDGISIRQTDSAGNLQTSNYSAAAAADDGTNVLGGLFNSSVESNTITETMSFTWQPTTINADGTVTGQLTYQLTPQTGPQADATTTISSEVTVANSLSMGVVGATGGNYGTMTFANDGSAFDGSRGTGAVTVNYIDKTTGQEIASAPVSSVTANVGDTVGVVAPSATIDSEPYIYNYNAPQISGYTYDSSSIAVSVANNNPASNVINVYYNPVTRASFTYQYATDVPDQSISLPTIPDTTGTLGGELAAPAALPELPKGYSLTSVIAPDQSTYTVNGPTLTVTDAAGNSTSSTVAAGTTALQAALAANPTYTAAKENFKLIVSANPASAQITINKPDGSSTTAYEQGLFGGSYTAGVSSQITDSAGNIYYAVVTIKNSDGMTTTTGDKTAPSKLIQDNKLTQIYTDDSSSVTVNYVLAKAAPTDKTKYDTKNIDDAGNSLTDTTGYIQVSSTLSAPETVTDKDGNKITTITTTIVWHKPVTHTVPVTVNKDDKGNNLSQTTGYVKVSESSKSKTVDGNYGDKTTTVTTTVIWHKPVTHTVPVTINRDDKGNNLTQTTGYVKVSESSTSLTIKGDYGDKTITVTTIVTWHKPVVHNAPSVTINKDDKGNALKDTTGYVQVNISTDSQTKDGSYGDKTVTIITTVIWHKPVTKTVPVTINKDEDGNILTDTSAYTLVLSGKPELTSVKAPNGDVTITSTVVNTWHKNAHNTVSTTVNVDESGKTITDTTGYVHSAQTKPSQTTSSTAKNGDVTTSVTNYIVWHKVQTNVENMNKDVDELGNVLTTTDGYTLISQSAPSLETKVAANGDITIIKTVTNTWHRVRTTSKDLIVNQDDSGHTLTNTVGYTKLSSKTTATQTIAKNGDVTLTRTTTIIWHKPVVTNNQAVVNKDTDGVVLSSTKGYVQVSKSSPVKTKSTKPNGDTTITNTTTIVWKKQVTTPQPSQQITKSNPSKPEASSLSKVEKTVSSKKQEAPQTKPTEKATPKTVTQPAQKTEPSTAKTEASQSTSKAATPAKKSQGLTAHQKFIHAMEVETAGASGAVVGLGLSGLLWTVVQRLLPAGFFAFIVGWKRRKKDDDK